MLVFIKIYLNLIQRQNTATVAALLSKTYQTVTRQGCEQTCTKNIVDGRITMHIIFDKLYKAYSQARSKEA